MSIGMYPIPPPDWSTLEKIFGPNNSGHIGGSSASDLANMVDLKPAANIEPKTMAIFELLDYIVNEPPPKLEHPIFSEEFKDFVDKCLKKNPDERADLKTLINHEWIRRWESEDVDVADWVTKTMDLPPSTPNRNISPN